MKKSAPALLIPLLLALAGCGGEHQATQPETRMRSVQARVEQVGLQPLPAFHAAPATVVAAERVEVASRLMGYIRDIAVVEGQAVSPGQRLFTVDPLDVEGQVEQARHAVKQAEDAHRDAQADHERYANLYKDEVVTRQQYEKMKLALDMAATRLAQARAQLATASGQLRYATVASPIAGVVTRRLADRGDLAAPGQPVLVVESVGRLQVETHVPESILAGIRPGQVVEVEADGVQGRVQARIARISPAADPVSHSFLVKLELAGTGPRSGAFARVLFPTGAREVLTVPSGALVRRAGIDGVFVLDAQGVAHFRMVRTGEAQAGRVEIQAGLVPGERVVTEGADKLESGDKVTG